MIYIFSIIHLVFVLMMFVAWKFVDHKLDYRRYWLITLVIGSLGTFIYDFTGVFIFNFWEYSSTNIFEYLFIAFCTYVVATPLFIETINFLRSKLGEIKLPIEIRLNRMLSGVIATLFSILIFYVLLLAYNKQITLDLKLFFILFVAITLTMDLVSYAFKSIGGPFLDLLDGKILSPLSIVLSGFFCGFLWEIINLLFPLWTYKNLPPENILGIPIVVILLWGTLNAGYRFGSVMIFGESKNQSK